MVCVGCVVRELMMMMIGAPAWGCLDCSAFRIVVLGRESFLRREGRRCGANVVRGF